MEDLKNHKHGDDGGSLTHFCCNGRLKELGGKSQCCQCVPHNDCELNEQEVCPNCGGKLVTKSNKTFCEQCLMCVSCS